MQFDTMQVCFAEFDSEICPLLFDITCINLNNSKISAHKINLLIFLILICKMIDWMKQKKRLWVSLMTPCKSRTHGVATPNLGTLGVDNWCILMHFNSLTMISKTPANYPNSTSDVEPWEQHFRGEETLSFQKGSQGSVVWAGGFRGGADKGIVHKRKHALILSNCLR